MACCRASCGLIIQMCKLQAARSRRVTELITRLQAAWRGLLLRRQGRPARHATAAAYQRLLATGGWRGPRGLFRVHRLNDRQG